ncbi:AMP-dependent synthetase and ligase [Cupriavidus basilensis OR16]|uniref:AMP-dependent synthetase and ligase n=1 Tax=Cupriavidus basilensis OR16 TaxID=1127483 RepID=H1S7X1_9BURK|nr:AMP-binding protein [Cupriavidus basilensis]EHP41370.1 AMP-dependent synthetase and ligase [Cupriavidus basilensis OR16]
MGTTEAGVADGTAATRDELILANLIANRVESEPDRDVLTFDHEGGPAEVRTYRQLWENGCRIAAALERAGMAPGDRFALLMQNHPEFVDAMVGASISGTVFVPIDPRTRGDKLAYMLRHSGCRGVICADYALQTLIAVRQDVPDLTWVWLLESDSSKVLPLQGDYPRMADILGAAVTPQTVRSVDPLAPMQIMYTSGTTGDPKGVVMRHARYGAAAGWAPLFGYVRDDRPYTGLSLTHGNAQIVTLAATLKLGMRAVFSRRFTKSRLWDVARRYGCTTFTLLGGMTTAVYSEPPKANDADNPVRFVISAGMPAAIWEAFAKRFDVRIVEFYGAVEGGLCVNLGEGPVGSIGKPPPFLNVRVVDEQDRDVPANQPGELIFQPANGTPADVVYLHNPDASAKKTSDGWLRMGDIGHRDEQVIAECEDVADVYVYGVPAASGAPGEKDVVAAIVPTSGRELDPQVLFEYRLKPHK